MANQVEMIKKIFRENQELALNLRNLIQKYSEGVAEKLALDRIKIMNFCGTHEWTTVHYGLRSLLPESIDLVAGPGCPVCITPGHYVKVAVKLAMEGTAVYTYGDTFKLRSAGIGGRRRKGGVQFFGCHQGCAGARKRERVLRRGI